MKKLMLLLSALLFVGCAASWPQKANLNPVVDDQLDGLYQPGLDISVNGSDERNGSQIIKIALPDVAVTLIPNQVAPNVMLAERLQNGFQQQGLAQGGQSNINIGVVVEELQATLTKPGVMFNSNAKSRIKLTVSNNGNVLTKEYNRASSQDSVTRPDIHDLEVLLNEQLSEIMSQALSDNQIRGAIKGQF
jgi:uncharacterized lipoprotein YajG